MPKTRHDQFVITFNDFISHITERHYPLLFEY